MMVFDIQGNGIELTAPAQGVRFDLDGDGAPEQVSWTAASSDDAILAVDLNGNHQVDSGKEIVGRQFRLPGKWTSADGASALLYELQGFERGQRPIPPRTGEINAEDGVFERLRLWTDANHDGRTQPRELAGMQAVGVTRIYTGYAVPKEGTPRSVDPVGNRRLFEGSFHVELRGIDFKRQLVEFEPRR